MKCPNCNFELPENTKFCPECGMKLPDAESKEEISEVTEIKVKGKKKKKKPMIIIISIVSAIIFVCGIIFWLMQNPFCLFYHHNACYKVIKSATCTEAGLEDAYCEDCGDFLWSRTVPAKGHSFNYEEVKCRDCGEKRSCDAAGVEHKYENAVCGKENTCVECGEKKMLQHELYSYYDNSCMYCGQDKFSVKLPTLPITVHEYDYSNKEQSCTIVQMNVTSYSDSSVTIAFTVKSAYHKKGNNYSGSAKFGWKLYDSDGTVIDSGTAYSDANIKVGEQSKGDFEVYHLTLWKEYKLEILNLS